MTAFLHGIQVWLSRSSLNGLVAGSVLFKVILESIHIMANAVIVFAIGLMTLRLMGLARRDQSIAEVSRRFSPWIWASLAIVAVSGTILLTGAGRRGLDNPMFEVKLVTMLVSIALTAIIQTTIGRNAASWDLNPGGRAALQVAAPICFLLWVATVFAGRWLAYSAAFFPR